MRDGDQGNDNGLWQVSRDPINSELLNSWQQEKNDKKRNAIYFDEILPRVAAMLRQQVASRLESGKLQRYHNAIIILGHDPNPSLLLISSLRPETVTILHTPDKERLIEKRVRPFLDLFYAADEVRFVMLDGMGHQDNLRIIRNVVRDNKRRSRRVVCDITGGKKIMSVQLGIMANIFDADIAYIDASRYMEGSSVPYPGGEVLYVQRTGSDVLTEIQAMPYNRLMIRYEEGVHPRIDYHLLFKAESLHFEKKLGPDRDRQELVNRLNEKCESINARITGCSGSQGHDFTNLANLIQGVLIPQKLSKMLKTLKDRDIRLIMDEEVSAIPWELPLSLLYGIRTPIIRIPNKDEEFASVPAETRGKRSGVLLVKGSGEGIPGFDESFNQVAMHCTQLATAATHTAESRGSLEHHIAEHPGYRTVIYFGHAQYDDEGEKCGWVCTDGSVFGTDLLSVFSELPPQLIISSACESARAALFRKSSFAYAALRAGCDTFIGTNWLLEAEKSKTFLLEMTTGMMDRGLNPEESYRAALKALAEEYGAEDISLYNYIYYGR